MKKTTAKLVALLLATLLLLAAVTGCGGGGDNSGDNSTGGESAGSSTTTTTGDDNGNTDSTTPSEDGGDSSDVSDTPSSDANPDDPGSTSASASKNNSTTGTKGTAPTFTTTTRGTINSTIGKVDLKGYDFIIATDTIPVAGDSDYDDAVLARDAQIAKELNCTIRYEYYFGVSIFDDMSPLIMAGDKVADLILTPMHNFGKFLNAGFLYDINDLKEIKQDSICYDQIGFTNTTLKSGTYGILGAAIPWRFGGTIVYNKDLLKKMGLKDPVEHVRNNTWTWDTFKDMVSKAMKDLDNDGAYTPADQWAVSGDRYDGLCSFYNSSGNQMLGMKDKKITYMLDTDKAMDSLAALKSIFAIPGGIFNPDMILDTNNQQFIAGKVVFWLGTPNFYVNFGSEMDAELGIVPMPRGNNTDMYVSGVTHNTLIGLVPTTIKDTTKTATVIQRLFEVSYEKDLQELRAQIYENHFQSEDCIEMYRKYILPATYFDVAMLYKAMSTNTYNATECVVGNPIILNQEAYVAADLIAEYKDTCTKFLKVLNGK